jgi:FkbM family methyltransferase
MRAVAGIALIGIAVFLPAVLYAFHRMQAVGHRARDGDGDGAAVAIGGLQRLHDAEKPKLSTATAVPMAVAEQINRQESPAKILELRPVIDTRSPVVAAATATAHHPTPLKATDVACLTSTSQAQWQEDLQIISWFFTEDGLTGSGVYFEIGAVDGMTFSNTAALEKCLSWRGILIEASAKAKLIPKYRSSETNVILNSAVCKHDGGKVAFTADAGITSGRPEFMSDAHRSAFHKGSIATIEVPCAPLSSIFKQHSIVHIDFWSLDVEGGELSVLETVDFAAVEISVILFENAEDKTASPTYPGIVSILRGAGYIQFGRCGPGDMAFKSEVWISEAMAGGMARRQSLNHRRCLGQRTPPTHGTFLGMHWDLQCFTEQDGEPAFPRDAFGAPVMDGRM